MAGSATCAPRRAWRGRIRTGRTRPAAAARCRSREEAVPRRRSLPFLATRASHTHTSSFFSWYLSVRPRIDRGVSRVLGTRFGPGEAPIGPKGLTCHVTQHVTNEPERTSHVRGRGTSRKTPLGEGRGGKMDGHAPKRKETSRASLIRSDRSPTPPQNGTLHGWEGKEGTGRRVGAPVEDLQVACLDQVMETLRRGKRRSRDKP